TARSGPGRTAGPRSLYPVPSQRRISQGCIVPPSLDEWPRLGIWWARRIGRRLEQTEELTGGGRSPRAGRGLGSPASRDATMMSTGMRRAARPEAGRPAQRTTGGLSLAVADACWATTENLFREMDRESLAVLMLKCLDYVNGWRQGLYPWSPACRLRRRSPSAWEQQLILPPGWMKRYPRLGMRPIAHSIRSWWGTLWRRGRGLVMVYPHYLYLRDQLRPDVSVYYNVDDYTLYWPRHAERLRELERAVVRSADLTVCVARLRADELKAAVPEAS